MASESKIEWTRGDDGTPGATWNPVVGCAAVSPGCDHCYAAREASGRLSSLPVYAGLAKGGVFTGEVRCLPERLDQPLRWRKPRRIFVNSMSDLFHPDVDDLFIAEVFAVMGLSPHHTFQVLTKRPKAMAGVLRSTEWLYKVKLAWHRHATTVTGSMEASVFPPYPNVWLGTSIESQTYAFRARHLLETPAAVRFLSCEPLLGPLDLREYLTCRRDTDGDGNCPLHRDGCSRIGWVIVGGESGAGARPMDLGWVRSIRDQCQAAGVPLFVKQLSSGGPRPLKELDQFPEDLRLREYPDA